MQRAFGVAENEDGLLNSEQWDEPSDLLKSTLTMRGSRMRYVGPYCFRHSGKRVPIRAFFRSTESPHK